MKDGVRESDNRVRVTVWWVGGLTRGLTERLVSERLPWRRARGETLHCVNELSEGNAAASAPPPHPLFLTNYTEIV